MIIDMSKVIVKTKRKQKNTYVNKIPKQHVIQKH